MSSGGSWGTCGVVGITSGSRSGGPWFESRQGNYPPILLIIYLLFIGKLKYFFLSRSNLCLVGGFYTSRCVVPVIEILHYKAGVLV